MKVYQVYNLETGHTCSDGVGNLLEFTDGDLANYHNRRINRFMVQVGVGTVEKNDE